MPPLNWVIKLSQMCSSRIELSQCVIQYSAWICYIFGAVVVAMVLLVMIMCKHDRDEYKFVCY